MTREPGPEEFSGGEPYFNLEVYGECHKCKKQEKYSIIERDWLNPYCVFQDDSWLQTSLCPKCAIWHFRFWIVCILRWRIGRLSHFLAPGYGHCGRCKTNWHYCHGHSTEVADTGSGMFPLCELCWKELSPEERLPYYKAVFESWEVEHRPYQWEQLEKAVLANL